MLNIPCFYGIQTDKRDSVLNDFLAFFMHFVVNVIEIYWS